MGVPIKERFLIACGVVGAIILIYGLILSIFGSTTGIWVTALGLLIVVLAIIFYVNETDPQPEGLFINDVQVGTSPNAQPELETSG